MFAYIFSMKTTKNITSNLIKLAISVLIVVFLLLGPIVVFNKNNYIINIDKLLGSKKQSTILELWHIETFEGGSFSRSKFLQNQAVEFNKTNQGCFVVIKTLTLEQARLNLKNNTLPDMVSFGIGSGELFANLLQPFKDDYGIRKDLLPYGKINKSQLALPYMLGGYAVITNQTKLKENNNQTLLNNLFDNNYKHNKHTIPSVLFANNTDCDIARALLINGVVGNKDGFLDNIYTTYQSYESFVTGGAVSLVGTQRDVVRCINRTQNGKLDDCIYNYLGGYSDLVQYFGVIKNIDQAKEIIAFDFAKHLVGQTCQSKIKNIGMFSVLDMSIYNAEDDFCDFEKALQKPLTSVSVFASKQVLDNNKANSRRILGI